MLLEKLPKDWESKIKGGMLGLAVGDALGVPFEFLSKEEVRRKWTGEMVGGGTWGQKPGTWSDDTGLALAIVHGLFSGGVEGVAREFVRWFRGEAHTLGGPPFDVGGTTRTAITRLLMGVPPSVSGVVSASCGSLMRNLPVAFYGLCFPLERALDIAHRVSRVTHAHPEAEMACGLHSVIVRELLLGRNPRRAVETAGRVLVSIYAGSDRYADYVDSFRYLLRVELLYKEPDTGSCYAPETLRASLWALVTSGSFEEAVSKAIMLGDDTDTVGAITGGMAGVYYGVESIPERWLSRLRGIAKLYEASDIIIGWIRSHCPRTGTG